MSQFSGGGAGNMAIARRILKHTDAISRPADTLGWIFLPLARRATALRSYTYGLGGDGRDPIWDIYARLNTQCASVCILSLHSHKSRTPIDIYMI